MSMRDDDAKYAEEFRETVRRQRMSQWATLLPVDVGAVGSVVEEDTFLDDVGTTLPLFEP